MKAIVPIATALLFAPAVSALAAGEFPDPAVVTGAMKKAAVFYQSKLAVHGGYASAWKKDFSAGMSEHNESKTLISIQPPGTTTMGLVLVRAYRATGDKQFLDTARAAGQALIDCQLQSGGWESDFDFGGDYASKAFLHQRYLAGDKEPGRRLNTSTLDDNKTESALLFLLELSQLPEMKEDAVLQECFKFGMDSLLGAQFPNGAWPQQFSGPADPATPMVKAAYPKEWSRTFPKAKYSQFYTLNDNNMQKTVELLLRAHELTKEERYLTAAKKAGDFFIMAQMPEPQPVWAQQYNFEMEPAWARKFEPPSVTGGESVGVMQALHELWVVTGDEKYLKPIPAALAWFDRSALPDGSYARFYELQTNKPLYFTKDKYVLTYDDSNMPTHYGFKLEWVAKDLKALRERMQRPREELLAQREGPSTPKSWASRARGAAAKTEAALKTQTPEGYWVEGDVLDAADYVRHMQAMTIYVEGCRKSEGHFPKP